MSPRPPQWELTLVILTFAAAAWSSTLSPYYLSVDQILYSTRQFVYPGILAIGLAVVVILGEIDISLASTLAFGAVLLSKFSAFGAPIWLAVPLVVAACAALGTLNGLLVARLNLPSLAVTLGTMGAYRGLAFILGSEMGYTSFDDSYLFVGSDKLFGALPLSFVLFLAVALSVGALIRRTVFGGRRSAPSSSSCWKASCRARALSPAASSITSTSARRTRRSSISTRTGRIGRLSTCI